MTGAGGSGAGSTAKRAFWREVRAYLNPIQGAWEDAQDEGKAENSRLRDNLAQARARITVLGRVDEAAREYSYNGHVPPCRVEYRHCTCGYTDLLHALDAAQAKP